MNAKVIIGSVVGVAAGAGIALGIIDSRKTEKHVEKQVNELKDAIAIDPKAIISKSKMTDEQQETIFGDLKTRVTEQRENLMTQHEMRMKEIEKQHLMKTLFDDDLKEKIEKDKEKIEQMLDELKD